MDTVTKMKLDFEDFLQTPTERMDQYLRNPSDSMDATYFLKPEPKRSRLIDGEKEAELIKAKATICELETKVKALKTSGKRTKIEFEKDLQNLRSEYERKLERFGGLRQKQQVMINKEEDLQAELSACRGELESTKSSNTILMKEKLGLTEQLREIEATLRNNLSELKSDNIRYKTDLNLLNTDLESTRKQLESALSRNGELHKELMGLEEHKMKALSAECKVKELEQKLSRVDEDAIVAKNMRTLVSSYPELEKQNKKLKDEIQSYKNKEDNVYLLKEQLRSATAKLELAEQKVVHCDQLRSQVEMLQSTVRQYEISNSQGKQKTVHPDEMKVMISDLQMTNSILKCKEGELMANVHSLENKLQEAERQMQQLRSSAQHDLNSSQLSGDHVKKLRRKMTLLAKERDSYKELIESYENEMTVPIGQVSNNRVKQLEQIIDGYQQQMAALEAELDQKNQLLGQTKLQCNQLEGQVVASSANVTSLVDQELIRSLQKQVDAGKQLQADYEKLLEEKEILQARMEQRNMQGEYDPRESKVIHFRMNPADLAQKQRALELKLVKEENQKLKERLKLLEESGGQVDDLTVKVEQKMLHPSTSKQVTDLQAKLEQAELKNLRFTEVFKKTSKDIREVCCYQLLGYKFDIPGSNQYRLMSMYAESPNDYLLFQKSDDGDIQLLQNEYTATHADKIDTHLNTFNSIPAFLSALTLDLFSRQTMVG